MHARKNYVWSVDFCSPCWSHTSDLLRALLLCCTLPGLTEHIDAFADELHSAYMQVVAYNKIDVPDSGDYIDEVREFLLGEGVPPEDIFAISAATGQGVRDLVRRVRDVLDTLPVEVRSHSARLVAHKVHAMSGSYNRRVPCTISRAAPQEHIPARNGTV